MITNQQPQSNSFRKGYPRQSPESDFKQTNYGSLLDNQKYKDEFSTIEDKYQILTLIGKGSYGIVVKAYDLQARRYVAIKKFNHLYRDAIDTKRVLREVSILRQLNQYEHPNIVKLYDIIIPDQKNVNEIFLVMEYCEMDLKTFIHNKMKLTSDGLRHIIGQILKGLLYMQRRGVIHRDIKPANICLNFKPLCVKICDFGLARDMSLEFDTEELLEVFFEKMGNDNSVTEEGISYKMLKNGIEHESLSMEMEHYIQLKLEHISKDYIKRQPRPNAKENQTRLIAKNLIIESSKETQHSNGINYYSLYSNYKSQDMKLRRSLTPHVCTRWYRSPEILLLENIYTNNADIWSLGCILGELLLHSINIYRPIFPGEYSYCLSPYIVNDKDTPVIQLSQKDQLILILQALGKPTEEDLNFLTTQGAKKFIQELKLQYSTSSNIDELLKTCDQALLVLLKGMLKFNPLKRISIVDGLHYLGIDTKDKWDQCSKYPIINHWDTNTNVFSNDNLKQLFLSEENTFQIDRFNSEFDQKCSLSTGTQDKMMIG